jgi:hypothetical protein
MNRITLRALALASLASLSLFGCAPSTPDLGSEDASDETSALGSLSAQAGAIRVTLQGPVRFEERDGQRVLVIKGSANRNLTGVFSFVPDDAFGSAALTTSRKFEIVLRDGHEQNSVLSGMPLLVRVDTATSGSATARITLGAQFTRFQGSKSITVAKQIRPVFVIDPVDYLRYRGEVSTTFAATEMSVFTDDDSDPEVVRVDADTFRFDWQFPSFALAADPHTDAVFFHAQGQNIERSKEADIDVFVKDLQLTTSDPYEAFPTFGCEESIYWCILGAKQSGATDLGDCGTYRDVARCYWPQPEEVCLFEGPSPFTLQAIDSSGLEPAAASYTDACGTGGSWCSVGTPTLHVTPDCLAEPASLDAAVAYLASSDQNFQQGGSTLTRAELEQSSLFSSSYSSEGPALLATIDSFTGGGEVQAYVASGEVPCHNCTDFADYVVLFYPGSRMVVVVTGTHGYDS